MHNSTISCAVPTSVVNLSTVSSTTCVSSVATNLNTLTMTKMFDSNYYIGTWGNSDAAFLGDWANADGYKAITTETVKFDPDTTICEVPLVKRITVFFSYAASDTNNDTQQKYV
jgi:hypothetical protein